MSLVKWHPIRELEDISSRLNRIFGQHMARPKLSQEMLSIADWSPSADISETDTGYLINAEIPGVKKEDVKVSLQNGMLTIQGERKMEKEEKNKKFHRVECSYGSFMRSFQLPNDTDENSVKAEFKDGMLNITLSKSEKIKSKTINVSVS